MLVRQCVLEGARGRELRRYRGSASVPKREGGRQKLLAGQVGWLQLFSQPGRRADFGTPTQSLVKTGHLQGWGMADEHLARKVEAQAAMLQAPFYDTALEYRALTAGRPAQLVGATTTGALLACVARGTIAAADGGHSPGEAVTLALPQ